MAQTKLRYFDTKRGRVEIIPMIDVMLFLLVFFVIVMLQMIPDAGVSLQLPDSTASTPLPPPQFTVNIKQNGHIVLKGKTISNAQLTATLKNDANPAKTELTIAAAKKVPFQDFIRVMDDCRAAGVTDIGVATEPVAATKAHNSSTP